VGGELEGIGKFNLGTLVLDLDAADETGFDACVCSTRLELVELDGHIFEEVVGLVWMNEKAKEMKEMAERSSNLGYGTIIN
ncbi:hypothetical protein PPACK8108_LOCUS3016, partial [Phakopsora pachyrhizi]